MKVKRWVCLLLCLLICCSTCGCGSEPKTDPAPEVVETKISQAEAEAVAKQEIVNRCCDKTMVHQLKFQSYNVISAQYYDYGEPNAWWEIEVRGLFYPVDSYGSILKQHKFDASVRVDNHGRVMIGGVEFSCSKSY